MSRVTEEQVNLARSIDLLSYLQNNEPHELKKSGRNEYRTVSHGSLVISHGLWVWNKTGVGGRSALDFLIKVRGMGFVDAVQAVCGARAVVSYSPVEEVKRTEKKWDFYPPKPILYSNRAVSYLQKRGITPEVIRRCMDEKILYESRYYNPESKYHNTTVCAFIGKDDTGKAVFAAMRGVDSDLKQDKAGSDKRFNFCLPAKQHNSRQLAIFEAPIDLLSHTSLQQKEGWEWDGYRLSLGGTSSVALVSFLERNPQISRVILHLDNDAAGLIAARKIRAELADDKRFKHIKVSVNPPRLGKDYNEALLNIIRVRQEQKQASICRDAGISL